MNTQEHKWKKITVKQAVKYSQQGYLVWWRPNGVVDKQHPEYDEAWIMVD